MNLLSVMGSMCCLRRFRCLFGHRGLSHGAHFYARLSQVAGLYKGDASGIWDRSRGSGASEGTAYEIKPVTRIHRVPEELIGLDSPEGIAVSHQVAITHYLSTWATPCNLLKMF